MSVEAYTWALNLAPVPMDEGGRKAKPNSACAFVLVGLGNHADPDGRNAFPGVDTLCRYTRLSERTVRTALDRLEAEGVIRPCDPEILAAKIKRADRRPNGYDLNYEAVRTDLTDDEMHKIARDYPWLRPLIEQELAKRTADGTDERGAAVAPRDVSDERGAAAAPRVGGAAVAPRDVSDERGAAAAPRVRGAAVAPRDATGCNPRSHGVQPTQPRGAAAAPEPSLEPSMEPSGKTAPGKPAAQPDAAGKLPIDGLPDDPEPADPAELARFREASAIATRFTDWYVANHGPIIARGKARPYCALRDAVVDVLKAGYDEREIRRALANLAEPVPGTSRLQAAVVEVRSGQRPGSSTSQRRGNVHISDMDDDDRNAQRRAWGGGS